MKDELISYIGIGSNLGDSPALVRRAMERLARWSIGPVRCSSLWRSDPVDCPPGSPPFINAVAGLRPKPDLTPEALLEHLREMEREFGRLPGRGRHAARSLDLDLLAWGEEVRTTPRLVLPHPRAHLRRFVLAPWAEIAPRFVLPGQTLNIRALLDNLDAQDQGDCQRLEAT